MSAKFDILKWRIDVRDPNWTGFEFDQTYNGETTRWMVVKKISAEDMHGEAVWNISSQDGRERQRPITSTALKNILIEDIQAALDSRQKAEDFEAPEYWTGFRFGAYGQEGYHEYTVTHANEKSTKWIAKTVDGTRLLLVSKEYLHEAKAEPFNGMWIGIQFPHAGAVWEVFAFGYDDGHEAYWLCKPDTMPNGEIDILECSHFSTSYLKDIFKEMKHGEEG